MFGISKNFDSDGLNSPVRSLHIMESSNLLKQIIGYSSSLL